ncbi:MAG: hypothetical protein SV201_13920, partial [Pseudomonadota bacterium]|nr:hypothetical protein [Pseudomonadota bacterium]
MQRNRVVLPQPDGPNRAVMPSDQINMLLQTIYRQFNKDHGLTDVKPRLISMSKYKRELDRL